MQTTEIAKIYEIERSNWWYLSRSKITREWFDHEFGRRRDLEILDIASACGMNFTYFGSFGRVTGIDISEESIGFCIKRGIGNIIQTDAMKLPFKRNHFDAILAFDALEHFEDDKAALKEFYEVLKPGGKLFITVPALRMLWSQHDEAFRHVRRYSARDIRNKLEDCGFGISRMSYWSCCLVPFVYMVRKARGTFRGKKAEPKSDFFMPLPPFLENILGKIQDLEFWFIKKGLNFPFGVSLICSAYRK